MIKNILTTTALWSQFAISTNDLHALREEDFAPKGGKDILRKSSADCKFGLRSCTQMCKSMRKAVH